MTERNGYREAAQFLIDAGMTDGPAQLLLRLADNVDRYPDSQVNGHPGHGDYDHRYIQEYLTRAVVCTRLSAAEACAWLNDARPPGTSNGYGEWIVNTDRYPDEEPCLHRPDTHRHINLTC